MNEYASLMPQTEVRHLALVIATAEHGTLTNAGRQLHLSPSALSHQLRGLEERLGAQLFERRAKRLHITSAGQRFLETARRLLSELRAAEEAVHSLEDSRRVVLRVSTECYTCYGWLPAVLRRFQERSAEVDVRIVVEATRRPVDALLAGELDIGILSAPVHHVRLATSALFRDELVVLMSRSHRLSGRERVRAIDLAEEQLFTYAMPLEELDVYRRILQPAHVRPRRVTQVELTEALIELVRANLGVAVMARWALPRAMHGLSVVGLTPKLERRWVAAWPKRFPAAEQIAEVVSALRETAPLFPTSESNERGPRTPLAVPLDA